MIQCPSCGGALRFEIETQQMVCDLCSSHFDPKNVDTTRGDSTEEGINAYDVAVHICPSCGAELMTNDANDAVGFCPFCGGASMIFSQIRQQWKPDAVLPFRITKEQCKQAYLKEAKKSPFVSKKYRDPALIESFRGIYMPYWIIDTEYNSDYGLKVTTREEVSSSTENINENHFVGHAQGMSRYVHDASLSFSDDISEALAPYPVTESQFFSAGYLSGFYTEISDLSETEYDEQVDEIIAEKQAEYLSRHPAVCDNFPSVKSIEESVMEQKMVPQTKKTMRALCPVWFMSSRKKDKLTYAAVNGVTGKVAVDLPLSPIKILLTALITGGLLFVISLIMPTIKAVECMGVCGLLMLIGLAMIETAYQKVLVSKLNIKKEMKPVQIPWWALIFLGIYLVISLVTNASGGSLILFIFVPVILVFPLIRYIKNSAKINAELKKPIHLRFRPGLIQEIRKYKTVKWVFNIIEFVLAFAAIVIIMMNPPAAFYMYALCFLMTASLFGAAIAHIRFQVALSMRRPPQMDKKGALYDEN